MVLVDPLTAAVDLVIAPMAHIAPTAYASLHHRATTSSIALLTASFARSLIGWILTHATTAIAHPEAKGRLAAGKSESASEADQIPDQKCHLP